VQPYLPLAEKLASLAVQTTEGRPAQIEIKYSGEIASIESGPITRAVLVGLLRPALGDTVNPVNAPMIAKSRGIEVVETKTPEVAEYSSLISVSVKTDKGVTEISGTLYGARDLRVVRMAGFPMDMVPEGVVLVAPHKDEPGIIGKVGTLLGEQSINIASMYVGRKTRGQNAIMVLSVDAEIPKSVMDRIAKIPGIDTARQVIL
jgi:D-3-phosphoglycerate dehydrogenase